MSSATLDSPDHHRSGLPNTEAYAASGYNGANGTVGVKCDAERAKPCSTTVTVDSRESNKTKFNPILMCMEGQETAQPNVERGHVMYTTDLPRACHTDHSQHTYARRASIKNANYDEESSEMGESDNSRRVPEARTSRILTAVDSADLQRTRSLVESVRHSKRLSTRGETMEIAERTELTAHQRQLQLLSAQIRAADAQRYAANSMTRYYDHRRRHMCVIL